MAICALDMGKLGGIRKASCQFHGRQYLTYNWSGPVEGVRVKCMAPGGCAGINTHFETFMFAGESGNEVEE